MDVNGEVNFCENSKKNIFEGGGGGGGGVEGPIKGWGGGGSKVWVRRVMWGMGDVNQE